MTGFLISAAAVVVVLGIMILVHEWGHFVAAKLFGVRVEIFSFGFGPRLWGIRQGPTDYRLSALPLGGYVKMAGDNPAEERAGAPDEFLSKPRWQRFLIALAGPTMNVLMALLIVIGLFLVGMPQPVYMDRPAVIAGVLKNSPAEKAGIQPGDRVAEINGVRNPRWDDVLFELMFTSPGSRLELRLDRAGRTLPVSLEMLPARAASDEFALLGYPQEPVVVSALHSRMPAERSGLKPGDEILAADARPILSPIEFAAKVQDSAGKPLDFLVRRGGQQFSLRVKPEFGDPGDGAPRWQIGASFRTSTVYRSEPVGQAISRGFRFNLQLARQIVFTIASLVQGKVSLRQLEGPVGIARQSGEAVRRGALDFLNLMAIISLNLGILNLLPIPILDGGHILMLVIEGTIRRDLSVVVKERIVQAGLVFLLVIFAIVMYNDVLKLLPSR